MSILTELQSRMKTVRLAESALALPELVKQAETQELSYSQFLLSVMTYEQHRRAEKQIEKRMKWAMFPVYQTLAEFSLQEQHTLKPQSLNQLKDFAWLDQLYNLIFLGPTGVGNYRKSLFMERNKKISINNNTIFFYFFS